MIKCIICNNVINSAMLAVLDEDHKAHLQCWCNLLPDMIKLTEEERKDKLKELIKIFIDEK